MNRPRLMRALERLQVLLAIRRSEEDELEDVLLALLVTYWADQDADAFRIAFLAALRAAYESLPDAWAFRELVQEELDYQAGFLDGFIADLEAGKLSEAQARARARSYAGSVGKVAEQIRLQQYDPDREFRWDYSETVQDHCEDCIWLNGQVHKLSWFLNNNHIPKSSGQVCFHH